MAEAASSSAPTTFAEFEAAGGKYNAAPEPSKPVEAKEETSSEAEPSADDKAETAAEPEPLRGGPQETAQKPAEKKPPGKTEKPKLSLSDEHARLLKEVTELRRERRELQQQPQVSSPPAPQAGAAADDKPPTRPKLSSFQGTLEEYEKAVDVYEEDLRKWQDRQFEKREAATRAKVEQERIGRAYGEKLAVHLEQHPEYDAEIAQTPMSPLMVDIVLHHGPDLGQALIEDKPNAQRISQLPRDIQIFEMGKLAAGLSPANGHGKAIPEPEPEAQQPVKIPARVGSGGGSPAVLNRPDHGAKNFAEWQAIENRLKQQQRKQP